MEQEYDWFEDITEYRPSADLIDQWLEDKATRPAELNEDVALSWLKGIYDEHVHLLADLNAKSCECRKLMAELNDAKAELSRKDGTLAQKDRTIADWQEWGRKVQVYLPNYAPEHG